MQWSQIEMKLRSRFLTLGASNGWIRYPPNCRRRMVWENSPRGAQSNRYRNGAQRFVLCWNISTALPAYVDDFRMRAFIVLLFYLSAALPKPYVSIQDFYREFHLGLCLGVHKNIVSTYDVAFETSGFYVFTQEYAPLGKMLRLIIRKSLNPKNSMETPSFVHRRFNIKCFW